MRHAFHASITDYPSFAPGYQSKAHRRGLHAAPSAATFVAGNGTKEFSVARCENPGSGPICFGPCPRHDPVEYAEFRASHRAIFSDTDLLVTNDGGFW